MSTPLIIKYPYDPTGLAETNLVVGEPHSIPILKNRAFALNAGPFFADSVVVRTQVDNTVLVRDVDYVVLYIYQEATRKVGQEISAVIFVTNVAISGLLLVDYQVLGGEFSSNVSAIQQLIESLEIDNRAIVWDDIIDRPVTFPPAPHLHDVGDLYGMEAVVNAINDLNTAVMQGDQTAIAIVTDQVSQQATQIISLLATTQQHSLQIAQLLNRVAILEG